MRRSQGIAAATASSAAAMCFAAKAWPAAFPVRVDRQVSGRLAAFAAERRREIEHGCSPRLRDPAEPGIRPLLDAQIGFVEQFAIAMTVNRFL